MNSANQVGKWMRQFSNVTNKGSRATDVFRSTGLNDDSLSHHKPLTIHELTRCRGRRAACDESVAAASRSSEPLALTAAYFCSFTGR